MKLLILLCALFPMLTYAQNKPNVVLILADDLGWGDVSLNNSGSKLPTPNFDRIGTEGMRFSDAHSSTAVCTPTRYGLLTGRLPFRGRWTDGVFAGDSAALIE